MKKLATLFLLVFSVSLSAQNISYRLVSFVNPTPNGSTILKATIWYPSTATVKNAPIVKKKGGYPVVVFAAGTNWIGRNYLDIGVWLALQGFVAVMNDSFPKSLSGKAADSSAWLLALKKMNLDSRSFFYGALDPEHYALMGHSLGAASCILILENNPGYKATILLAPLHVKENKPASVRVPSIILAGDGDRITPPLSNAVPIYAGLTKTTGMKVLYRFNKEVNHFNIGASHFIGATKKDEEIFSVVMGVATGFLEHWLDLKLSGLDKVVGSPALWGKYFLSRTMEVQDPRAWDSGSISLGTSARVSALSAPGFCAVMLSLGYGRVQTPFGLFELDSATTWIPASAVFSKAETLKYSLVIPKDPKIVGLKVYYQGLGVGSKGPRFTNSSLVVVKR